jgi:RNA polymerase sigma-70 factor, ECF subfamily
VTDSKASVPGSGAGSPEEALLERAASGDGDAFGALVRLHQDTVYRYLLALTRDEEDALDLAQNTFLKAFRGLARYRRDAPFRNWLLAIARNEARTRFTVNARRKEEPLDRRVELEGTGPDPEEAALRSREVARVRQALATLPEKQRMSVALRLFEGLSYREIGEATGSTEGTARVNYHHGIRRLRDQLEKAPTDGPELEGA